MNKKLALLMFAIGLGATAAPAFADKCEAQCFRNRKACLAENINGPEFCEQRLQECLEACT